MTYTFSDYNIVSEKNGVAYVANTLSGALIRLDEPSYQAVQSQNLAQLSEKDRNFLADNGVLIEDTMDEKRMLRLLPRANLRHGDRMPHAGMQLCLPLLL